MLNSLIEEAYQEWHLSYPGSEDSNYCVGYYLGLIDKYSNSSGIYSWDHISEWGYMDGKGDRQSIIKENLKLKRRNGASCYYR